MYEPENRGRLLFLALLSFLYSLFPVLGARHRAARHPFVRHCKLFFAFSWHPVCTHTLLLLLFYLRAIAPDLRAVAHDLRAVAHGPRAVFPDPRAVFPGPRAVAPDPFW